MDGYTKNIEEFDNQDTEYDYDSNIFLPWYSFIEEVCEPLEEGLAVLVEQAYAIELMNQLGCFSYDNCIRRLFFSLYTRFHHFYFERHFYTKTFSCRKSPYKILIKLHCEHAYTKWRKYDFSYLLEKRDCNWYITEIYDDDAGGQQDDLTPIKLGKKCLHLIDLLFAMKSFDYNLSSLNE